MDLRLACGHTQKVTPREDWLRVIRLGCMRCRMEAKTQRRLVREVLLVGGPQDGKRARVGGVRPAILLNVIEAPLALLMGPETVARWNAEAEWYEVVRAVGCVKCGGTGGIPSGPFGGARMTCPDCGGRGSIDVPLQ